MHDMQLNALGLKGLYVISLLHGYAKEKGSGIEGVLVGFNL